MKSHTLLKGSFISVGFLYFICACLPLMGVQPGDLDPRFVPDVASASPSRCLALQDDGKILVGGSSYTFAGLTLSRGAMVRLSASGLLEPSFCPPMDGVCYFIDELPDGTILAGGDFRSLETDSQQSVLRLTRDGRLHPDFKLGEVSEGVIFVIKPQQDGRLLIGGRFSQVGGLTRPNIARLNSDGTVDPTFDPGAGVVSVAANGGNTLVYSIELDASNRVLVAGVFELADGRPSPGIARFMPDGRLDETFVSPLRFDCNVRAARWQPDGKILLGGAIQVQTNSTAIIRLLPDGGVDPSFVDRSNLTSSSDVNQIQLDSEGRILVASKLSTAAGGPGYLVRLLPDGSQDLVFSGRYTNVADGIVRDVAIQPDGNILIAGDFTTAQGVVRGGIARLHGGSGNPVPPSIGVRPGVVPMSLGGSVKLDSQVRGNPPPDVQWFHNGSAIIGATNAVLSLINFNGAAVGDYTIRAVNSEGVMTGLVATVCAPPSTVDRGAGDFSFFPSSISGTVNSLFEQSECRILAGTTLGIHRLSRDGEEDFSFSRDARTLSTRQMILDGLGNILAVGNFTSVAGLPRSGVARFTAEGVLDASFLSSGGLAGIGTALAMDLHGRLYVARNDPPSNLSSLVRLLVNGSIDSEFQPITNLVGKINVLLVRDGGGVLAGGLFREIRGQVYSNLAAFNDAGDLDPAFVGSADGEVLAIAARSDGKLLFGGAFSKISGVTSPRLVLTDKNGAVDAGFASGAALFPVSSILMEPSGSILTCNVLTTAQSSGGAPPLSRFSSDGNAVEGIGGGGLFQGRGVNIGLMTGCGNLLVGGQFTAMGGLRRLNIARVQMETLAQLPPLIVGQPRSVIQSYGEKAILGVAAVGQPLTFRWYKDGQYVKGADQCYFTDSFWDPTTPRHYTVTVSNSLGFVTSAEAVVISLWDAPKIDLNPVSQTVAEGQAVLLSAKASGNPQPVFQWQRNGVAISGETNATVLLPELHAVDTGAFTVVASNPGGAVTSSVARVLLLPVVDLNDALNTTNWLWISSADSPWSIDSEISWDSVASARSGFIPATSDSSLLQTRLTGPGSLTFKWKVSSRTNSHLFVFQANGVGPVPISGESGWKDVKVQVGSGPVDLSWRYIKRSGDPVGSDRAWLDQVRFAPSLVKAPQIGVQPVSRRALAGEVVQLSVYGLGVGNLSYQWMKNGTELPGETRAVYRIPVASVADSGTYTVAVANAAGRTVSAEAVVLVSAGPPRLISPRWAQGDALQFDVVGDIGARYRVEYSQDMINWKLLREFVAETAVVVVEDATPTTAVARFYRALALP